MQDSLFSSLNLIMDKMKQTKSGLYGDVSTQSVSPTINQGVQVEVIMTQTTIRIYPNGQRFVDSKSWFVKKNQVVTKPKKKKVKTEDKIKKIKVPTSTEFVVQKNIETEDLI